MIALTRPIWHSFTIEAMFMAAINSAVPGIVTHYLIRKLMIKANWGAKQLPWMIF
ncbi:MAG: hypothetical protein M9896_19915 [Candidatus Promineofilum sp.]|uniref:hypothetical protein n=1 Tax=Promineifilum sp. TaxID=2664178 RepID=UPI002411B677|nr:hypothetical protein [Promineifilum sp.]